MSKPENWPIADDDDDTVDDNDGGYKSDGRPLAK